MPKYIALLSFICVLVSCGNRYDKDYAQLIKGDWLGQKIEGLPDPYQTEFISFEDSTCRTGVWRDVPGYEIYKGAVYFLFKNNRKKNRRGRFKIVKLTADSL